MISRKLYRGATVLAADGVLRLGMKPMSRRLACPLRVFVPRTAFKLSLRVDLARFLTDQTSTLGLLTVTRRGIHDKNAVSPQKRARRKRRMHRRASVDLYRSPCGLNALIRIFFFRVDSNHVAMFRRRCLIANVSFCFVDL